jgi:hypothetical protein
VIRDAQAAGRVLDWLQSYWGAVVALIAILGSLWGLAEKLEKKLEHHQPLREWVADGLVMPSWHDSYRNWLGRQLDHLQSWMGGPCSGRAFVQCLAMSLLYPMLLMVVGYGFGGPGAVGQTEFLPPFQDWRQALMGFGLVIVIGGVSLSIIFSNRIDNSMRTALAVQLARRRLVNADSAADRFYRIGGAIAAASLWYTSVIYTDPSQIEAVIFALLAVVALLINGTYTHAAEVLALGIAIAILIAVARTGAVSISIGIGAAVTIADIFTAPLWLTFAVFFLILPLWNALLDWPSWAMSRWLGHDLHDLMQGERRRLGTLLQRIFRRAWQPAAFVLHIALDLAAAMVLLLALAALLPFVVQLFNLLATPALALDGFLAAARDRPWPNAIWPVAMLLTTLIPTALHAGAVIIGLFLWLIQPTEWRRDIVAGLRSDGAALAWAATRASWLLILTPLAAGLLVVLLAFGLVRLIGLIEPVGLLLLDAAHFGIAAADLLADPLP